jgi:hypothetical protein
MPEEKSPEKVASESISSPKPIIFISYAHADEPERPAEGEVKWLSFVTGYLRPAVKHGAVEIWIDRLMRGGDNVDPAIERKLRACDIFVLLVSPHSLSSDYIIDKEIAIIRERQANGEDVHFYPLLLTPTPKIALDKVRDKNLRPRDAKPFSSYSVHDRNQHMSDAADEIAEIAGEIAARNGASTSVPLVPPLASEGDVHDTGGAKIRIILGSGTPFETVEPSGVNMRQFVRVKLQNNSAVGVANCKLDVVNLDPPSGEITECALKTDIIVGPKSEQFVDVACHDIGSSQGLPGRHIHLAVPMVGGFFAEAYGYANLPLIRHTFQLRLSRFSEVHDERFCALYLDAQSVLKLESGAGSAIPQPEPSSPARAQNSLTWDEGRRATKPQIDDERLLKVWLRGQSSEVAVALTVRMALRLLPLAVRAARKRPTAKAAVEFASLTSALFRAAALARVAAKFPTLANDFGAAKAAAAAASAVSAAASAASAVSAGSASASASAAARAVSASASVSIRSADAGPLAAASAAAAVADAAADAAACAADAASRDEIRSDIGAFQVFGANAAVVLPLWSRGAPEWAKDAWAALQAALPRGADWEVWIEWYEERLRGGSRGEAYEVVFASVPLEVWDEGPAAANAWIREHLPKDFGATNSPALPEPLPGLDSPFTYAWNAAARIAIVAGPQNLPHYPFFTSEDDHRQSLQACRVGAERLLKSLRDGRLHNVRTAYAETLEYYLEDLPNIAGAGNILLANDQARALHAMFAYDADQLPPDFAGALGRVIANQFALNGFYDLVQRHERAVNAANWTQPFPTEAAKRFFGVVEQNTPHLFEPEVAEGVQRVERAAPPVVLAPDERREPSSALQPPPLPAGAPDAEHSRQRQIATSANALYEVFLKGKDLPMAIEGWTRVAHSLGEHIGPLLNFLRGLGTPL